MITCSPGPGSTAVVKTDEIEWSRILKRLTLSAALLGKAAPDVFDGVSAEDLPGIVLQKFFDSTDHLGWDGQRDLARYLCEVLKHDFIDRLRRHQHNVSIDDVILPTAAEFEDSALTQSVVNRIRRRVRGDKTVEAFIEVAISDEYSGGHKRYQELSSLLRIPLDHVDSLIKKIARRLKDDHTLLRTRG